MITTVKKLSVLLALVAACMAVVSAQEQSPLELERSWGIPPFERKPLIAPLTFEPLKTTVVNGQTITSTPTGAPQDAATNVPGTGPTPAPGSAPPPAPGAPVPVPGSPDLGNRGSGSGSSAGTSPASSVHSVTASTAVSALLALIAFLVVRS